MKKIPLFICVIFLLLCGCEQIDTHPKTNDGKYIEYIGHPNLYHKSRFYDVIRINDTTFLCLPTIDSKNVMTIKISAYGINEREN